jgi:hypothetical protein
LSDPRQAPLQELIDRRDLALDAIRRALQPIVPADFSGKITITVDMGSIAPHAISVEMRKSQEPKRVPS